MNEGIHDKRWEQKFILPEQRTALLNRKEQVRKIEKPILDEYQLEEMARVISEAMEFNSVLVISVYRDGFIEEVTGHVHYIDEVKQRLHVKDLKDDTNFIAFESLLIAETYEGEG
ncbi:YolD-like family protein [Bacillus subtilis]|uniref:YolD-like family protein n=1 Tax=Bacillus subtilis TaxID=1423 RepID=UPI002B4BFFCA|nr:YolD-like family protein [Bacillus subtilis]MEC0365695.1 YolD-like family protein [Bacillus subtilis]MEC0402417.1 YolD-like family protein [Bacillus subtilis]MEC0428775.1 YolD-like family protein [Bacillus subtilis]WRK89052.1 YolD-like family protein [Bacillus subtilis]WRS94259.1 YolD-like family protein [Bacillus subtilis]